MKDNTLYITLEQGKPMQIWTLSRSNKSPVPIFLCFEVNEKRIDRLERLQGNFKVNFIHNQFSLHGDRLTVCLSSK